MAERQIKRHAPQRGATIDETRSLERGIEDAVRTILTGYGEDPDREGLRNTPRRVRRMYAELLRGYEQDPAALINGAIFNEPHDEMVVVRDIEYSSLCEHHLLPFLGHAHVAYIPKGRIIGLSKGCIYVSCKNV